jgi:hypothetical protein
MLNQFKNISCYEEFEIQCALAGISKVDVLKNIGHRIGNYYFFMSNDGIFNWFDLEGNHIKNPGVLKELKGEYIPKNIIKYIIPNSVTSISNNAFFICTSLKSITIPNGVTNIGAGAFAHCKSLISITIPNSVTRINGGTFYKCKSLKEIIIPDSITRIGDKAFSNCESLKEITIPNSITSIDIDVFYNCISLKEVIFKGKTLDEVKKMENYPFGIEDESIIKYEINDFSQHIGHKIHE